MDSLERGRQLFHEATRAAEQGQKDAARAVSSRKLKQLFPEGHHRLGDLYIHPEPVKASKVLKNELPAALLKEASTDVMAFFRTANPRGLWCIIQGDPGGLEQEDPVIVHLERNGEAYTLLRFDKTEPERNDQWLNLLI